MAPRDAGRRAMQRAAWDSLWRLLLAQVPEDGHATQVCESPPTEEARAAANPQPANSGAQPSLPRV